MGKNRQISCAEDFQIIDVDITLSRRGSKALRFVSVNCEGGGRVTLC